MPMAGNKDGANCFAMQARTESERARTDTHHVRTHSVGPRFSYVCIQFLVCAQLTSQRAHISKDTRRYTQKRSGRSAASGWYCYCTDRPIGSCRRVLGLGSTQNHETVTTDRSLSSDKELSHNKQNKDRISITIGARSFKNALLMRDELLSKMSKMFALQYCF